MKSFRLAVIAASLLHLSAHGAGLDLAGMDKNVRPQDDLYRAMNGGWEASTPMPADKAIYGSFHKLRDLSDERVKAIVEDLAVKKGLTGVEQKVATFYRGFMDTAGIDKRGMAVAKEWLERVEAVRNDKQLAQLMGEMAGVFRTPVFLGVGPDDKDTHRNVPQLYQSGLGLPDRDYYLKDNPKFAKAREAYRVYLETLLKHAGEKSPAAAAREVLALEQKLAEAHWDKVANRDPVKTYNPMDLKTLAEKAPGFDWGLWLKAAGLSWHEKIIVAQPSMVEGFANLLGEFPIETWRAYFKAHLLDSRAEELPQAIREASFQFRGKTLQGLEKQKPRWQLAALALNQALGEAVGQVYVAKHFPPDYKSRMQALVDNLLKAYGQSIDAATWMTPETKAKARQKLALYTTKIGYPDQWRDYSALAVRDGEAFANAVRGARFEHERKAREAGQKVDRGEWYMPPQTVNAYYNPNFNEIVFPAAILQAPFFDMAADDAVNYGGIGTVIGHEISHGFDDSGSQYDGEGHLKNWWTEADRKAFEALGERLVKQFEAYEPLPGHKINGKLTLGENIADLSGLQIAYKAYQLSLAGKPAPVIDGLSGDQRFFYSYGQIWRTQIRDDLLLQRLTTDPHSPSNYRANGAAVNDDAFHAAFGTKEGDKMWKSPLERIRIW